MPAPSWPGVIGRLGFTGQSPSAACRSVWQTPLAMISTKACPGPGAGTGSSRITRGSRNFSTTAAFIIFETAIFILLRYRTNLYRRLFAIALSRDRIGSKIVRSKSGQHRSVLEIIQVHVETTAQIMADVAHRCILPSSVFLTSDLPFTLSLTGSSTGAMVSLRPLSHEIHRSTVAQRIERLVWHRRELGLLVT